MANDLECLVSVDVESSGPIPGDYSLLSVGACVVGRREQTFYAELKPLNDNAVPEALQVTGFELAKLRLTGEEPQQAITKFADWVRAVSGTAKPVFVGFNAGFDWSFVNWYRSERHPQSCRQLDLRQPQPPTKLPDPMRIIGRQTGSRRDVGRHCRSRPSGMVEATAKLCRVYQVLYSVQDATRDGRLGYLRIERWREQGT